MVAGMGFVIATISQTSADSHLLLDWPQPCNSLAGRQIHGLEYPCPPGTRQAEIRFYKSYKTGSISEKPTHMMIVSGMPTRMKSENV